MLGHSNIGSGVFLQRIGVRLQANGRKRHLFGRKTKLIGRKRHLFGRKAMLIGRKRYLIGRKPFSMFNGVTRY